MNDIFYFTEISDFIHYVNDNTQSTIVNTVKLVLDVLKQYTTNAMEWFAKNIWK